MRRALGIERLHIRIDQLEQRLAESYDERRARSTSRWRETTPNIGLTWGMELSAVPFITAVEKHGGFRAGGADGPRVLEIGPGYGRLVGGAIDAGVPFVRWTGLDLSEKNVAHLTSKFSADRTRFLQGDAMDADLDEPWDLLVSSLTIKHIYPSFEPALENLLRFAAPEALIIVDLIEGSGSMFEDNQVTYIRRYSKPELTEMMERLGLKDVAFDSVVHAKGYERLLLIARR